MTTINVNEDLANEIKELEEKYNTTAAEIVETLFVYVLTDINSGDVDEEEIFG